MKVQKLTVIAVSVLLIIGFMTLAFIMGNRLGAIAEDTALSIANLIARANARIAKTELQRPLKFGKEIAAELSSHDEIESAIDPLKRLVKLRNIIETNIVGAWVLLEDSASANSLTGSPVMPQNLVMKQARESVHRGEESFSNPYFKVADSTYFVCFSLPFTLKSKQKGAVLIEMNLNSLYKNFIRIESFGYGYVSIVSRDGKYVSHPERDFIGKNAFEIEKHSFLDTAFKMRRTIAAKVVSEYLNLDVYRIFLPLDLDAGQEHWLLMVSIPYFTIGEISKVVTDFSLVIGVVSSIFLIVIIALFIRQLIFELTKRLKAEDTNRKLRLMQNKLVLSEKMASLGELTAGIAHEMNNPLNFIVANISPLKRDFDKLRMLYGALLKESEKSPEYKKIIQKAESEGVMYLLEESGELIDSISEGAKRTATIVSGLYDFSRLDAEQEIPTNVNESVQIALSLLKHRTRDIQVCLQLGGIPQIKGQPGKLQQVFMNFISNSVQAIEEKMKTESFNANLLIETKQVGGEIEISIEDNGLGIEKKHLKKIYDPFFTTKAIGQGVGLGLSISYGIIKQHKGRIELSSEHGKGTSFKIYLKIGNQ